MLASSRRNHRNRRGVVLILILGVLALMAVIGVTFAIFSGQSRISARNFAQSVNQPQRDELMDYALAQLIGDTADIRSTIRGHSMARDMYGNDAANNGYLSGRPDNGQAIFFTQVVFYNSGNPNDPLNGSWQAVTNIPINDPAFYGFNFTRWIVRFDHDPVTSFISVVPNTLPPTAELLVGQTFEILSDDAVNGVGGYRVFYLPPPAFPPAAGGTAPGYVGLRQGFTSPQVPPPAPYNNNTVYSSTTQSILIGESSYVQPTTPPASPTNPPINPGIPLNFKFNLDGRWLHAFNGPGMTNNAVYANFRYNGPIQNPQNPPTSIGNPNLAGMDEDYDACDLENWFLALQSADGQVVIPSFHRPGVIRYDPSGLGGTVMNDWSDTTPDAMSRILRPRQADGHDSNTFRDLIPNASTGMVNYDVDNDGDGLTDSVWVDLGYPARTNANGKLYKPLFAFMVIGLNGKIPLNTAGNLAGRSDSTHSSHLGNSVSEIDPTYALQNGVYPRNDVTNTSTPTGPFYPPLIGGTNVAYNTQVDSAGVDVRLTQLRNLLAGTRPQRNPFAADTTGQMNGDNNYVAFNNNPYFMPNGGLDSSDTDTAGNYPASNGQVARLTPPVAGRWGEAQSIPGYVKDPNSMATFPANGFANYYVVAGYKNPVRAGYSLDPSDVIIAGNPRDAADDNYNSFDPYPAGHTGEVGDRDFFDAAGAPVARRADAALPHPRRHQRHRSRPAVVERHQPWPRPGRRPLGPRDVLQLLPSARIAKPDRSHHGRPLLSVGQRRSVSG